MDKIASETLKIEVIATSKGEKEVEVLENKIDKLGKTSGYSSQEIEKISKSTQKAAKGTKKAKEETNYFIDKLKEYSQIAAVIAGIKLATNEFVSFDNVLRRLKATTGASYLEMRMLEYQARKLGKSTEWSAQDSAEAQLAFSKAGFTVAQSLAAMSGVLNTATVGELGLAEAAELVGGTLRTFKMEASEATRVGDMLAKTADITSTDVRGLGESIKEVGGDTRLFGLDLSQTLGILGSLGNEMLKGGRAGNSLRAALSALKNSDKRELLAKYKVDIVDDKGKFKNFIDIAKDMKVKLKVVSEVERADVLNKVFGEEGGRAVTRIMNLDMSDLDKLNSTIANSEGYAKDFANTLNGGLGGALKGLKSMLGEVAIAYGQFLEPSLITLTYLATEAAGAIAGFGNWLNSGSYLASALGFAITGVTTGLVVYKGVLMATTLWTKATALATGGLAAVQKILRTAFLVSAISGGGLNTVLGVMNVLLTPITGTVLGVAAAIAGVGMGFVFLYKKVEWFKKAIDPLLEKIKSLVNWMAKLKFVQKGIEAAKKVKDTVLHGGATKPQEEQMDKEIDDYLEKQRLLLGEGKVEQSEVNNTSYSVYNSKKSKEVQHNGFYLRGDKNGEGRMAKLMTSNPKLDENGNIIIDKTSNTTIDKSSKYTNNRNKSEVNNKVDKSITNNKSNVFNKNTLNDTKESFEEKILSLLENIKNGIVNIKNGHTISVVIPPELSGDELIIRMVEDLKVAILNLQGA